MPLLKNEQSDEEQALSRNWLKVREVVKQRFGKRPDINAMLMIIGINELGIIKEQYEKEEKQDLMHIAICKLFEPDGYFKFIGNDEEGWPHYDTVINVPKGKLREQEALLKQKIIDYFIELQLI